MASLRSLALRSEAQSALDSRRLSRELSELGTTDPGRNSASGEATIMEDPTLVVGLLNIAGVFLVSVWSLEKPCKANMACSCSRSCSSSTLLHMSENPVETFGCF